MAENKTNPMDSFREKLGEALKGENKAEGIKVALMDLMKAYGVAIPDIEFNHTVKGAAVLNNATILESFTKKIHAAIKGEHQAQDIRKAVNELLKAYGIPVLNRDTAVNLHPQPGIPKSSKSYTVPKPHVPEKSPCNTKPTVQVGHMNHIEKH